MRKASKKLTKEWYKKLKQSGFDDLEYFSGDDLEPNDWMKRPTKEVPFIQINEMNPDCPSYGDTVDYYSACENLLLTPEAFASEQDRQIWAGHTKGYTTRHIGEIAGCSHTKVQRTIEKYREKYLLRKVET